MQVTLLFVRQMSVAVVGITVWEVNEKKNTQFDFFKQGLESELEAFGDCTNR